MLGFQRPATSIAFALLPPLSLKRSDFLWRGVRWQNGGQNHAFGARLQLFKINLASLCIGPGFGVEARVPYQTIHGFGQNHGPVLTGQLRGLTQPGWIGPRTHVSNFIDCHSPTVNNPSSKVV
jgi:hypothetical protein